MDRERYASTPFGEARRTPGRHGYVAYFAAPIPRSLGLPPSTVRLLADAEGALGQLAGIGRLVPNPDLLIRPYLLREALSSTRIEGTQATMAEVYETDATGEKPNDDVEEVVSYMAAMRWGLDQREGVRGSNGGRGLAVALAQVDDPLSTRNGIAGLGVDGRQDNSIQGIGSPVPWIVCSAS